MEQPEKLKVSLDTRCDLLSFFEQLIFGTTIKYKGAEPYCCDLLSFFEQLIFGTTVMEV
uniref:hypothetical protein n=1 Tax=Mucilaginibacter psychrotolerans TaxID=1524096 RepID=UPI0013051F95|nr:hypothetical protein [Mucilaginibacter psychrotolerans]